MFLLARTRLTKPFLLGKAKVYPLLMRSISIRSPFILTGLLLIASIAILNSTFQWREKIHSPPSVEWIRDSNSRFLEPTVVNPIEIPLRVDSPSDNLQPIGVTKKNSWNPNPSWRADAGWPTNQRPASLRPVTIEKIPDTFPLSSRKRTQPPTIGDAIPVASSQAIALDPSNPNPHKNPAIVPWSSFVDAPIKAPSQVLQLESNQDSFSSNQLTTFHDEGTSTQLQATVGLPNSEMPFGRAVSTGHTVNSATSPPIAPPEQSANGLSPVDSQRFIRQPVTKR